ncbi:MAG: hypothetical protein WC785_08205 [Tatlockia sp.]
MKTMLSLIKGFVLAALFISNAYSGIPVWTFTPLTPTTVSINNTQRALIRYQVTNQSQRPHALVMTPINGVREVTLLPHECSSANTIGFQDSCFLTLIVDGRTFSGNIYGGPMVCQNGNLLECYRPSAANRLNVSTTPGQTFYTIGGNIIGLIGTVVLQNGADTLTTSTDGTFAFPTAQTSGTPYLVTVQTQPTGQTCTVTNQAGIVTNSNITNIQVTCSSNAQTYTVGGTVSGLSGTIVLANNGNTVSVTSPGTTFTFPAQANGSTYSVTIQTLPAGQTCAVANGTGTISGANVTNVTVTCSSSPTSYTVGGTVSGLVAGSSLVIANYNQDPYTISANGSFTYPTQFPNGSLYAIGVYQQPISQTCTVTNGSGVISGSNVTNIVITCVTNNANIQTTPRTIIPVGGPGTGSIIVSNNGSGVAFNVHAVLPSAWTSGGVTQDATGCTTLNPLSTCTLTFSSPTLPFVAQGGISIVGDNVVTSPTVAIAFSINGFTVYAVDTSSSAKVVNTLTPVASTWGLPTTTPIGLAFSLYDGFFNTQQIVNNSDPSGDYAARACYNSTQGGALAGTWFMPAICQLGPDGQGAGCVAGLPNVDKNLYQLGFLGSSTYFTAWSSTQPSSQPIGGNAWSQDFVAQIQIAQNKGIQFHIFCVRAIPY